MKTQILVACLALSPLMAQPGFSKTNKSNALVQSVITATNQANVVETKFGKVAGYEQGGIHIFKGIPYAKAKRFQAPQDPDAWQGIRSSRAYGPTCPQPKRMGWYSDEIAFSFDWDDGYPNEDCMRLNIWTPELKNNKKRAVMVWLHGGGFTAGSGQELPSYDGFNLANTGDVVVVTLNHRLNILGFLDLSAFGEKYKQSGNAGLLDLVKALEWVKQNIANFGGDPNNITIFGQSGGGGKVSTLLATPSAKGLFQKAIVESGSMLGAMESKYSQKIGAAVLEELSIAPNEIDKINDVPYEQLAAAGDKAVAKVRAEAEKEGASPFIFGWSPVVDGDVLPYQPGDDRAFAMSKDIPMIVGTTIHEFSRSTYVPQLRNISKEQAMKMVEDTYKDKTPLFMKAFTAAYPNYKPLDLIDTDFRFRVTAVEQMNKKAAVKAAPVYAYLFTWESPVLDGALRSTHCMEIPFVFNNALLHASMTGGTPEACRLAETMSQAWTSFAKTGVPTAKNMPQWVPYTKEKGATMFFDNKCQVKYGHDKSLIEFLQQYPIKSF